MVVAELLEQFLAGHAPLTRRAYAVDLEEFGRFMGGGTAQAVAMLLDGGEEAAGRLLADFAAELERRGRASATIDRRLYTLRALARLAQESGLIEWAVAIPRERGHANADDASPRAGVPYLFPPHPTEVDRLDIQHFALRATLDANLLAPVVAPGRVLDVGSGTGQWAFEVCAQFPGALVVGLDLVASKPSSPAGYRWVRSNVLQGLPFGSERFDLVHQRLMVTAVPLERWPALVGDLARVTRPGGWVELVEPMMVCHRPGPATERLTELALRMASSRGLDAGSAVFDGLQGYLRAAGLQAVERRQASLPIGEWGGQVGSLMATDFRAVNARITEVLRARSELSPEECEDLLRRAQRECEEHGTSYTFAVAFGRKPG